MNGREVRESWGCPRRIAHNHKLPQWNLWYVCGLLYMVITWIIGQVMIWAEIVRRIF